MREQRMLNVSRLRLLRELHRCGTLAEVARVLSYTPSAISQQLTLLEREAGVLLLDRAGRGVRLTDAAVQLVAHTEAILARLEQAEAELSEARPEVTGTVRVASFQSVIIAIAPLALSLLAERHPQLLVEITQREMERAYEGLLAHHFDLILGEEYPGLPAAPRTGVDRVDITTDDILLALPEHGPYGGSSERLEDAAAAPWALDPQATVSGRWGYATCRAAGFEPHVRFETPDPLLHAHLIRGGHAVGFVPGLLAADHLAGIRLIRLPGGPQRVLFSAVRAGRTGHPALRAVRDALADAAQARWPGAATGPGGWSGPDPA